MIESTEIRINTVDQFREQHLNLLKENDNYCPLKGEHVPENKCICKEFRDQKDGWCRCGLYEKIVHLQER